jgi:hypothetical protein
MRKSKQQIKENKLLNVFHSILSEWRLSLSDVAGMSWNGGFLLIKDKSHIYRSIPDIDRELYRAICSAPPIQGTVRKFNPDGTEDRFA